MKKSLSKGKVNSTMPAMPAHPTAPNKPESGKSGGTPKTHTCDELQRSSMGKIPHQDM